MTTPPTIPPDPRNESMKITVWKNGPYRVSGGVPLTTVEVDSGTEGTCRAWKEMMTYPPMHQQYALCRCGQSKNKPFCDGTHAPTHFVGTESGDRKTPEVMAGECLAGRVTVSDEEAGETVERDRVIAVIEDPESKKHGPLLVQGGIPVIAADGRPYEVRDQVTLCRCGRSKNKPFCDGSHLAQTD